MAETTERPHRTGAFWLDMVVALSAVCVSIASLWVALRADRTQERLLAASVWPVLLYETSNYVESPTPGEPKNVIRFTITNAGVGPARLRWFDFYYRGKSLRNGHVLVAQCCDRTKKGALSRAMITNYMQGRILVAREAIHFVEAPRNSSNAAAYAILDRERGKVYVRACYCSVLDDCWLFDSRRNQPAAVRNCPQPDTPLYQG
jgi:hypothetical protein